MFSNKRQSNILIEWLHIPFFTYSLKMYHILLKKIHEKEIATDILQSTDYVKHRNVVIDNEGDKRY